MKSKIFAIGWWVIVALAMAWLIRKLLEANKIVK
jgi:hypothetical protein